MLSELHAAAGRSLSHTPLATFEGLESRTLLAAGILDTTFGTGGQVRTAVVADAFNTVSALAVQTNGRVIAVGRTGQYMNPAGSLAIVRYAKSGTLDTTFGSGGKVVNDIGGRGAGLTGVAIQPDGKIVVSGTTGDQDYLVARYQINGVLDTSFGTGGIVTGHFTATGAATSLALQPDGKILVAGYDANSDGYLIRLKSNGTIDAAFGTRQLRAGTGLATTVSDMAIGADGRIIIAGNAVSDALDYSAVIFVLKSDGNFDTTFSSDGKRTDPLYKNLDGLAVQPDGKILLTGHPPVLRRLPRHPLHH